MSLIDEAALGRLTLLSEELAVLGPRFGSGTTQLLEQGEYLRRPPSFHDLDGVDEWLRTLLEHEWNKPRQVVPAVHLQAFHDARVDRNGIVLVGERFLIAETAIDFPRDRDYDLGALQFQKDNAEWSLAPGQVPLRITQPALLLLKHGFDNYGHWLVEILPRLKLALTHLPADIHVAIGETTGMMWQVVQATLAALGVGSDRIITITGLSRFDTLYYVSPLTRHPLCISPFIPRFLLDTFRPAGIPQAGRRLFVSRRDTRFRRLVNEDELIDFLSPLGFEVILPGQMRFEKQVEYFSGAEMIVGVMGAGLTNMIFAPGNAAIFALLPSTMPDLFFWNLACLNGQAYYELRGKPVGELGSIFADFTLEVSTLRKVMENADALVERRSPDSGEGL